MGKALGASEIITRVNKIDYIELLKESSIQATISTRIAAANSILQDVRSSQVTLDIVFEDTDIEALEILLSNDCPVIDKTIVEIELPQNCLVAGVTRRENTFIPSGTWRFASKDKLVVFAHPSSIEEVESIFC